MAGTEVVMVDGEGFFTLLLRPWGPLERVLFYSLSHILHSTVSRAPEVRATVMHYVSNYWWRFKPYTETCTGEPYSTKPQYIPEMSKPNTYGTSCELKEEKFSLINSKCIPLHIFFLKVGVLTMLLRNLNPPKLCNNTRLQVKTHHKAVTEAKIFTGAGQGETVFIPRIPLIPSDYHFQFKRLQFPVKVCYAMTINKAQGQSLRVAGMDLKSDRFSHGQLYVACFRLSSSDSLTILQPEGTTRNVFYRDVLSS